MNFIPVNEPLLEGNEEKYLVECIRTGWISSEGPFVEKFENAMASRVGRKYGIAVANGSAALDVAVAALELEPGDEVILPTFTIISCVNAVIHAGGIPVLVDCELDTWNMNVKLIEEKITPKTKAIMAVHIFGLPVNMEVIQNIAEKHGLFVIEDAAQAIGLKCNNKECGSFGDISTFSFYPNKHITTGEGGMIVTNDLKLAELCRSFRNLCFNSTKRFVHNEMGWNYRMSNLQAAVGVAQLEKLDRVINKKCNIGKLYNKLLEHQSNFTLPIASTKFAKNIYWVYGLVIKENNELDAEAVMKILGKKMIGTRPFFWPMHKQPILQKLGYKFEGDYPVSEFIAKNGFYIPSGIALTESQQEIVSSVINELKF